VERAGGDQVFAAAFAVGEEEWNIGDLFGDGVYGAVNPGGLFVGVAHGRAAAAEVVAGEPSLRIEGFHIFDFRFQILSAGDVDV